MMVISCRYPDADDVSCENVDDESMDDGNEANEVDDELMAWII